MENLESLANKAREAITSASDAAALDQVRVEYLGKKGSITGLLKGLGKLSAEERPAAGAEINKVKQALQEQIALCRKIGISGFPSLLLEQEGKLYPLSLGYSTHEQVLARMEEVLSQLKSEKQDQ